MSFTSKNAEIVAMVNHLSIPFTVEDITKPNPNSIRHVYEMFVELLMGISKEDLQQPHFAGVGHLNHPELFEEAIPEVAFYRAL
jgi:kinetochore protein Nuf2